MLGDYDDCDICVCQLCPEEKKLECGMCIDMPENMCLKASCCLINFDCDEDE